MSASNEDVEEEKQVERLVRHGSNRIVAIVLAAVLALGSAVGGAQVGPLFGAGAKDDARIDAIHEVVKRTDAGGTPLVYSPRESVELLKRIVQLLEQQRDVLNDVRSELRAR